MSKGISFSDTLRDYLVAHSLAPSPEHAEITKATQAAVPDLAIMQIPGEQWAFMTFLTRLVGARTAVEVGTFTGSSALSIALGLPDDGRLICCDVSAAFIDADKTGYVDYYELLVPRTTANGVIVVDNVLQDGRVLDAADHETNTEAIRRFNDHVAADTRVDAVMLNVADGLTLIRRR